MNRLLFIYNPTSGTGQVKAALAPVLDDPLMIPGAPFFLRKRERPALGVIVGHGFRVAHQLRPEPQVL